MVAQNDTHAIVKEYPAKSWNSAFYPVTIPMK